MINKTFQRFAIVTSDTAQGFETALNQKVDELARFDPVVEFNMRQGHCAYIRYEEHIRIPEDARDEYALKGISYYCGECPFYIPSKDGRIKYTICANNHEVRKDHKACVLLYEKLKAGEVVI